MVIRRFRSLERSVRVFPPRADVWFERPSPTHKMPRHDIDNEMYFDDARRCTAKGVFAVEEADYENVIFGKAPAKPKPQGAPPLGRTPVLAIC